MSSLLVSRTKTFVLFVRSSTIFKLKNFSTSSTVEYDLPYIDKIKKKKSSISLMAGSNSNIGKQIYDYLLVLDFEATCDKKNAPQPQVR